MTDLNTMTIAQLTSFYNQKTGSSLKKFSTKSDGIRRCLPLIEKKAKSGRKDPKRGPSITQTCIQLIRLGKTNDEIWSAIQPQFGLDESKKYYPSWNRAYLRRQGEKV